MTLIELVVVPIRAIVAVWLFAIAIAFMAIIALATYEILRRAIDYVL